MNYVNTFISQSNPFDFLRSIYSYFSQDSKKNFLFELVFSADNDISESYSDNFFNKYKNELNKLKIIDEDIFYFKDELFIDQKFILDITNYLKNDNFLIMHVFYDVNDLVYVYKNGFESTLKNDLFRFEISRLEWEIVKLPNPYLYINHLSEELYQKIDQNYDLFNLGQATISLKNPWHITLNYISNQICSEEQIFDEKNKSFLKFNEMISDISKQLCDYD